MLRETLLTVSRNEKIRDLSVALPVTRDVVHRFVAGSYFHSAANASPVLACPPNIQKVPSCAVQLYWFTKPGGWFAAAATPCVPYKPAPPGGEYRPGSMRQLRNTRGRAGPDGPSARHNHSKTGDSPMLGLMQNHPMMISTLIDFAERHHGSGMRMAHCCLHGACC